MLPSVWSLFQIGGNDSACVFSRYRHDDQREAILKKTACASRPLIDPARGVRKMRTNSYTSRQRPCDVLVRYLRVAMLNVMRPRPLIQGHLQPISRLVHELRHPSIHPWSTSAADVCDPSCRIVALFLRQVNVAASIEGIDQRLVLKDV